MESFRKGEILNYLTCQDILTLDKHSKSSLNVFFEYKEIEDYLNEHTITINTSRFKGCSMLILLSTVNKFYKTYLQDEEYDKRKNNIDTLLKTSLIKTYKHSQYNDMVFYISVEEFVKKESFLFESCLIYRFSSFFILNDEVNLEVLRLKLSKFSFYSLHNYKRWRPLFKTQLFFDGENLSGNIRFVL